MITRGMMDLKQLHEILLAYEMHCKKLNKDSLPLNLDTINDSLRPVNLQLTSAVFKIWCQKCWPYMQCAQIEIQKTKKQQFGAISEGAGKAGGVEEALARISTSFTDNEKQVPSFQD